MIRLVVVAPSTVILAGLEELLSRDGGFTIVERRTHVDHPGDTFDALDIDVVLAVVKDNARFQLPLHAAHDDRPPRAWVLLIDGDSAATMEWLRRGARGVLPRDAEGREIIAAIEAVHAGLVVVPASDVGAVTGDARRLGARVTPPGGVAQLSPREREVLALLAEGLGNKIVAVRLGISEHTVKTHVASIFQKLGADTRAEAVAIGARTGVILL